MMKPILEQLKKDLGDGVRIIKIDIDKNPDIASQFGVRSVPTLALFKSGQMMWMQPGVRQVAELKQVIRQLG